MTSLKKRCGAYRRIQDHCLLLRSWAGLPALNDLPGIGRKIACGHQLIGSACLHLKIQLQSFSGGSGDGDENVCRSIMPGRIASRLNTGHPRSRLSPIRSHPYQREPVTIGRGWPGFFIFVAHLIQDPPCSIQESKGFSIVGQTPRKRPQNGISNPRK